MKATTRHPDLFGGQTPIVEVGVGKLSPYPAPPGSGPLGETCGSCANHRVLHYNKRIHKCVFTDTSSAATDIRVRTPACRYWKTDEETSG